MPGPARLGQRCLGVGEDEPADPALPVADGKPGELPAGPGGSVRLGHEERQLVSGGRRDVEQLQVQARDRRGGRVLLEPREEEPLQRLRVRGGLREPLLHEPAREVLAGEREPAAPEPRASSWAASAPATLRRTKRTASSPTIGSSRESPSASRSGVRRGWNGSVSWPVARSWSRAPASIPKRATSAERGSAPTSPIVARPNRASRARTSGSRERAADGNGARNEASPPGGTQTHGTAEGPGPVAAASAAANRVPAIPARGVPGRSGASAARTFARRTGSGPQSGSRPSGWTSSVPNAGSAPSSG